MKKIEICKKIKQPTDYIAFIPNPFPPNELFSLPQPLLRKASQAEHLLGKLDGITHVLPNIEFFLMMFAIKDATASSQIEGTRATMADALIFSAGIESEETDAKDIIYYKKALQYGIERIKEFPLSMRFIRELHQKLMEGARADHFSDPGTFRESQNWIGGTTLNNALFVPVPHDQMGPYLDQLESFFHKQSSTLSIVDIGYAHAQFETIHPFLDGNGRTGRLLITFLLMQYQLLEKPVLFLSSYFKKHQQIYYDKLFGYQTRGEVYEWIEFFLDGVIETAKEAIEVSKNIRTIRDEDMQKIQTQGKRESESGMKVLCFLFENPIVTTASIMNVTGFTRSGSQRLIDRFITLNILEERPQEVNYDRKYIYKRYFQAFLEQD